MHEEIIVHPLYYNTEKMLIKPPTVYRQTIKGFRKYYNISDELKYYEAPSVTTILDKVMPIPFWLEEWRAAYGLKKADEIKTQAAHYGTLMHICIGDYLIDGHFNLDTIDMRIELYRKAKYINFDTYLWNDKLKHDLLSFHKFCQSFNVKPLAIEIVLLSEELGYGGAVDLICEMTIGTGQNGAVLKTDIKFDKNGEIKEDKTRRITALVDFKSGRHGFSDSNAAQIHMYANLVREFYPHLPLERVYNWAPKDWDKSDEPTFHLKDQTDSPERDCIPHYVQIFYKKSYDNVNREIHDFKGILYADSDIKDIFKTYSFKEKALKRWAAKREKREVKTEMVKATDIKPPVFTDADEKVIKEDFELMKKTDKVETVVIKDIPDTDIDFDIKTEIISYESIENLFKD